jgi:hypothetical protein
MNGENQGQRWVGLAGVALLGVGFGAALAIWGTLTGSSTWDGTIGVVLGLFICSRPAANAVDVLFERGGRRRSPNGWRAMGWLMVNLAVMAVGWVVIVGGAIRLAGRAGQ